MGCDACDAKDEAIRQLTAQLNFTQQKNSELHNRLTKQKLQSKAKVVQLRQQVAEFCEINNNHESANQPSTSLAIAARLQLRLDENDTQLAECRDELDRLRVELVQKDTEINDYKIHVKTSSSNDQQSSSALTRADVSSNDDAEQMRVQLIHKDNQIIDLNTIILDKDRKIIDLQETCREIRQVTDAKTRAVQILNEQLLASQRPPTSDAWTEPNSASDSEYDDSNQRTRSRSPGRLVSTTTSGSQQSRGHRAGSDPLPQLNDDFSVNVQSGDAPNEDDDGQLTPTNVPSTVKLKKRVRFDLPPESPSETELDNDDLEEKIDYYKNVYNEKLRELDDVEKQFRSLQQETRSKSHENELKEKLFAARVHQLESEVEEAKREGRNAVLKAKAQAQIKINELQGELDEMHSKQIAAVAQFDILQKQHQEILVNNQSKDNTDTDRNSELLSRISELENECSNVKMLLEEATDLNTQLRSEAASLTQQMREDQIAAETILKQKQDVLNDVDELKNAIDAGQELINAMSADLQAAKAESRSWQDKFLESQLKYDETQVQAARVIPKKELEQRRLALKEKAYDAKIRKMEDEMSQLDNELNVMKLKEQASEAKHRGLERETSEQSQLIRKHLAIIEDLQIQVQKAGTQITDLKNEREKLSDEAKTARQNSEIAETTIHKLQEDLSSLKAEKQQLESKIIDSKNRETELARDLELMKDENDELREERFAQKARRESWRTANEVIELENECASLNEQLSIAQATAETLLMQKHEVLQDVDELKEALDASQEMIDSMDKDIEMARAETTELQDKLFELQTKFDKTQTETVVSKKELEQRRLALKEKAFDVKIRKLEDANEKLCKDLNVLRLKTKAYEAKHRVLDREALERDQIIQKHLDRISELEKRMLEQSRESLAITERNEQLLNSTSTTNSTVELTQTKLAELEADLTTMNAEKLEIENELRDLWGRESELKKQLATMQEENEQLIKERSQFRQQCKELIESENQLSAQLSDVQSELKKVANENNRFADKIKILESESGDKQIELANKLMESATQIADLHSTVELRDQDLKKLRLHIDDLNIDKADFEQAKAALDVTVTEQGNSLRLLTETNDQLKHQLHLAESKLKETDQVNQTITDQLAVSARIIKQQKQELDEVVLAAQKSHDVHIQNMQLKLNESAQAAESDRVQQIDSLMAEIEILKEANTKCSEDHKEASTKHEELMGIKMQESEATIANLRERLGQASEEIQSQSRQLEETKQSFQDQITQLDLEMQGLNLKLNAKEQDSEIVERSEAIEAELDKLRADFSELNEAHQQLIHENNQLVSATEEQQAQIAALNAENEQLGVSKEGNADSEEVRKQQERVTRKQLQDQDIQIQKLKNENDNLQTTVSVLQESITRLSRDRAELEAKLKADHQPQSDSTDVHDMQMENQRLMETLTSLSSELNQMQREKAEQMVQSIPQQSVPDNESQPTMVKTPAESSAPSTSDQQSAEIETLQQQLFERNDKLEDLEKTIAELQKANDRLSDQFNQINSKCARLEQDNANQQASESTYQDQIAKLKEALSAGQLAADNMHENESKHSAEVQKLTEQLNANSRLQMKLTEMEQRLTEVEKQSSDTSKENAQLLVSIEEERSRISNEKQRLQQTIDVMNDETKSISEQLERSRAETSHLALLLQENSSETHNKSADLELELNAIRTELSTTRQELEQSTSRISVLTGENNELKHGVESMTNNQQLAEELSRECAALAQQNQQLQTELDHVRSTSVESIQQSQNSDYLEETNRQLAHEMEMKSDLVSQLRKEKDELGLELSTVREEAASLKRHNETLTASRAESESRETEQAGQIISDTERRLSELTEISEEQRDKYEQTSVILQAVEEKTTRLNSLLDNRQAQIEHLESELRRSSNEAEQLREVIAQLETDYNKLQTEGSENITLNETLVRENQSLTAHINIMQQSIEQLENSPKYTEEQTQTEATDRVMKLADENAKLTNELQEVKQQLADTNNDVHSKTELIETLSSSVSNLQFQLTNQQANIEILKRKLHEQIEIVESKKQEHAQNLTELESLRSESTMLQEQKDNLVRELEHTQQQQENDNAVQLKLEQDIEHQRIQIEKAESKSAEQQLKIDEILVEKEKSQNEMGQRIFNLADENAKQVNEVQNAKRVFEEAKEQHQLALNQLQSSIDEKEELLSSMNEALSNGHTQFSQMQSELQVANQRIVELTEMFDQQTIETTALSENKVQSTGRVRHQRRSCAQLQKETQDAKEESKRLRDIETESLNQSEPDQAQAEIHALKERVVTLEEHQLELENLLTVRKELCRQAESESADQKSLLDTAEQKREKAEEMFKQCEEKLKQLTEAMRTEQETFEESQRVMQSELMAKVNTISQLQQELNTSQQQHESQQNELANVRNQLLTSEAKQMEQAHALTVQIESMSQSSGVLEQSHHEHQQCPAIIESLKNDLQETRARLHDEEERLTALCNSQQDKIKHLQETCAQQQSSLATLTEQIAQSTRTIDSLSEAAVTKEQENTSILERQEYVLEEHRQTIDIYRSECEELKSALALKTSAVTQAQVDCNELRQRLAVAEQEPFEKHQQSDLSAAQTSAELNQSYETVVQLKQQLERRASDQKSLCAEIVQLNSKLNEVGGQSEAQKIVINGLNESIEQLIAENERLSIDADFVDTTKADNVELLQKVAKLETESQLLRHCLNQATRHEFQMAAKLDDSDQRIQLLSAEITDLKQSETEAKQEHCLLNEQLEQLMNQFQNNTAGVSIDNRAEDTHFKQQIGTLTVENERLQLEYGQIVAHYQQLQAAYTTVYNQLEQYTHDNTQSMHKLPELQGANQEPTDNPQHTSEIEEIQNIVIQKTGRPRKSRRSCAQLQRENDAEKEESKRIHDIEIESTIESDMHEALAKYQSLQEKILELEEKKEWLEKMLAEREDLCREKEDELAEQKHQFETTEQEHQQAHGLNQLKENNEPVHSVESQLQVPAQDAVDQSEETSSDNDLLMERLTEAEQELSNYKSQFIYNMAPVHSQLAQLREMIVETKNCIYQEQDTWTDLVDDLTNMYDTRVKQICDEMITDYQSSIESARKELAMVTEDLEQYKASSEWLSNQNEELQSALDRKRQALAELKEDLSHARQKEQAITDDLEALRQVNTQLRQQNDNLQTDVFSMESRILETEELLATSERVLDERSVLELELARLRADYEGQTQRIADYESIISGMQLKLDQQTESTEATDSQQLVDLSQDVSTSTDSMTNDKYLELVAQLTFTLFGDIEIDISHEAILQKVQSNRVELDDSRIALQNAHAVHAQLTQYHNQLLTIITQELNLDASPDAEQLQSRLADLISNEHTASDLKNALEKLSSDYTTTFNGLQSTLTEQQVKYAHLEEQLIMAETTSAHARATDQHRHETEIEALKQEMSELMQRLEAHEEDQSNTIEELMRRKEQIKKLEHECSNQAQLIEDLQTQMHDHEQLQQVMNEQPLIEAIHLHTEQATASNERTTEMLHQEIENLKTCNINSVQSIAELELKHEKTTSELKAANDALLEANEKLQELENVIEANAWTAEDMQREMDKLKTSAVHSEERAQNFHEQLLAEEKARSSLIDQHEIELQQLKVENSELVDRLNAQEEDQANTIEELLRRKERIKQLEIDCSTHAQSIEDLQQQIRDYAQTDTVKREEPTVDAIQLQQQGQQDQSEDAVALKQELEGLRSVNQSLSKTIEELEARHDQTTGELESITEARVRAEDRLTEMEETIEANTWAAEDQNRQIAELKSSLGHKDEQIEHLQHQVLLASTSAEDLATTAIDLETFKQENSVLNQRLHTHNEEQSRTIDDLQRHTDRIKELELERSEQTAIFGDLQQQLRCHEQLEIGKKDAETLMEAVHLQTDQAEQVLALQTTNQRLSETIEQLEAKNLQTREELESVRATFQVTELKLNTLEEEIETNKWTSDDQQREIAKLTESLAKTEALLQEMRLTAAANEEALAMKDSAVNSNQKLTEELQHVYDQLAESERQFEEQSSLVDQLKHQLTHETELQSTVDQIFIEMNEYKSQIEELTNVCSEKEAELEELKARIEHSDSITEENTRLQKTVDELNEALRESQQLTEELRATTLRLHEQVDANDDLLKSQKQELEDNSEKLLQLGNELDTSKIRIDRMSAELVTEQQRNEQSINEQNQLRQQIEEQNLELQSLRDQSVSIQTEAVQQSSKEDQERIEQLIQENSTLTDTLEQTQLAIVQLQKKVQQKDTATNEQSSSFSSARDDAFRELGALREKIAQQERYIANCELKMAERQVLKEQLKEQQTALEQAKREKIALESQKLDLQDALAEIQAGNDASKEDVLRIREQMSNAESELTTVTAREAMRVSELQHRIDSLVAQTREADRRLEMMRSQLASKDAELTRIAHSKTDWDEMADDQQPLIALNSMNLGTSNDPFGVGSSGRQSSLSSTTLSMEPDEADDDGRLRISLRSGIIALPTEQSRTALVQRWRRLRLWVRRSCTRGRHGALLMRIGLALYIAWVHIIVLRCIWFA